jgi:phosphoenolpyruvate carboxykinase (GTP)
MGDYFSHWLEMGKKSDRLPRIYSVNWFRKTPQGKFLWPGYGENGRVLKWIFERTSNVAPAQETPIGLLPTHPALDLTNLHLDISPLLAVDKAGWLAECDEISAYFKLLGDRMPKELLEQLSALRKRLLTYFQ